MDQRILPQVNDSWPFLLGKSIDELKQSLLYAMLELEYTRTAVKEELERRDQQTKELLQLLEQACRQRDEANNKCNALLEKLLVHPTTTTLPPPPPQPPFLPPPPKFLTVATLAEMGNVPKGSADSTTSAESDSISRNSSSSTVQSLLDLDFSEGNHFQMSPPAPPQADVLPEIKGKLPEKGKLLQAVINAGPLLQTLLLAGPLPQWRHPPPPLDSQQIPPIAVSLSGGSSVTDTPFVKRSPEAFGSEQNGRWWSLKDLEGPSF